MLDKKALGLGYGQGSRSRMAAGMLADKVSAGSGVKNPFAGVLRFVEGASGFTSCFLMRQAPGVLNQALFAAPTVAQWVQINQMLKDALRCLDIRGTNGNRYWVGTSDDSAIANMNLSQIISYWEAGSTVVQTVPGNLLATLDSGAIDNIGRPEVADLIAVPMAATDAYISMMNDSNGHYIGDSGESGLPTGSVTLLVDADLSAIGASSTYTNAAISHSLDGLYGLFWLIRISDTPLHRCSVIPASGAPLALTTS